MKKQYWSQISTLGGSKKPIYTKLYTFDDLIESAKNQPDTSYVDGVAWSFEFENLRVSHETDENYIIAGKNGLFHIHKGKSFMLDVDGNVYHA